MSKENPVLPLRFSKLLVNKHLDCYYLVFELLLSDLSLDFLLYIWSCRNPIKARLRSLES